MALRQRMFAGMGAALFFITGSALTIMVIIALAHDSTPNKTDTTASSTTCEIKSVEGTAEALPATFKPEGDVTQLQTTNLTVGSGDAAKKSDCLQVKYYGTLATDGTVFDENYDKAEALQLQLGVGQVIPGWDQGLDGMKVGGERRIVIPSELAYGESGNSGVPANADLVFVVKLLKIGQ
jgi:peptidylprolyl isomerase